MAREDLRKPMQRCRHASAVLETIEKELLRWAEKRGKALANYFRDLRRLDSIVKELPAEWRAYTASQVAAGSVFANAASARKFRNHYQGRLLQEQAELLRYFERHPWFYTVFSVARHLEGDFHRVHDHASGRRLLLHSPALTQLHREGASLFLSLLFENGACCQTFGPMHYYRGFRPYDFEYLAKALRPAGFRERGLSAVIAARPAPFLLLDRWSEMPLFVHRGEPTCTCSDSVELETFSPDPFSASFDVERRNDVIKCALKGSDSPATSAELYYDGKRRRLVVYASGLNRYRKLVELLAGQIELPSEPYWYASMGMVLAARELAGKQIPAWEYVTRFEEQPAGEAREPEQASAEELETINAFLADLTRRRNYGVDYSLEELASTYGLSLESAQQLEAIMDGKEKEFELEIEGGFDGFRPPPPEVREKFRVLPQASELFQLHEGPEVRRLFLDALPRLRASVPGRFAAQASELELSGLPRLLEDMFFDVWQARDPTILTYTLYLLCRKGDAFHSARDYAAELLKLFWQVLLPEKDRSSIERFIRRYAAFCLQVLHPLGLVEIGGQAERSQSVTGRFRVRASPFFKGWFSLSGYWEEP
jgi:hypothetical protein